MRIDVLCSDGSPLGVTEKSIYGKDGRMGTCGAELALLTLCRAWHDAGHNVTLFNDPKVPNGSEFAQLPVAAFKPKHERDVVIIFRSPNDKVIGNGCRGMKIWLSCDQFTRGSFQEFAPVAHKIVTISQYHSDYFSKMYGIVKTIPIDLPIRTWEYEKDIKKHPYRCIYTSMPDRGVSELHGIWPLIQREVPNANLVITSDWRLWSEYATADQITRYKAMYARHPNTSYMGAVNRQQLIQIQLSADIHIYPCVYEELFCISVAESQVAGAYPITSDWGALPTTNMGTYIKGNPRSPDFGDVFVHKCIELLQDREKLAIMQKTVQERAKERFSVKRILKEWDERVFK